MSTRRNTLYQAAVDDQANQNAPLPQGDAAQDVPGLDPAQPPAVQAAPHAAARGAREPDDEPNPALIAGVGEEGTRKRTEKVDLRNVKSEAFSGAVPPGAYDSGVRDWWEQFADQVEDAQISPGRNGQKVSRSRHCLFSSRDLHVAGFDHTARNAKLQHSRKRVPL
ncbi:hypothetical protein DVH05_011245 [Phytophthora capsici]|nr:hypothetical protein DVH05_011245 [Phytophthora capsici]